MSLLQAMVPMRDGVRLETDVLRPDDQGRFPCLFMRCVYGISRERAKPFLPHGYAVVLQNPRGRGLSEGQPEGGRSRGEDGVDTLDWMVAQPWCDGRVGTWGGSAMASAQISMAFHAHPAHRAMAPACLPFGGNSRLGGAFMFSQIPMWIYGTFSGPELAPSEELEWMPLLSRLPTADVLNGVPGAPVELYRRRLFDPHAADFRGLEEPERFRGMQAACLLTTGWYDHDLTGTVDFYRYCKEFAPQAQSDTTHLIIGPWDHGLTTKNNTEYDFGPQANLDRTELERRFFDRHIKGDRAATAPPSVRYFVMGANAWRTASAWPPPESQPKALYLRRGGTELKGWGTLAAQPPEEEAPDRFVYDPAEPLPTLGGSNPGPSLALPMKRGPRNQAPLLGRSDLLVYLSEPLGEPLDVIGAVRLVLYAASSARDTDFTARLLCVKSERDFMLLQEGIVRARFRNGMEHPEFLTPGACERYEIDLWYTAIRFQPGERIGLMLSSSSFPRFNRNLNTGGDNERDAQYVSAEQSVFHDAAHPSHLLLPVMACR